MTRFKDLDPDPAFAAAAGSDFAAYRVLRLLNLPYIREQTGATAGNLSIQITKLKEAGYIEVTKNSGITIRRPSAGSLLLESRNLLNM